jgi:hypothetical protein
VSVTPIREVTYIDKSEWPDGPWKSEPDKVQWKDKATGLPCLAVRNRHSGHWCGYVGVAEGHPAFELPYDDASALGPEHKDGWKGLDVHGGLTYSAFCQDDEDAEDHGICHVPQPGEPDRVWWLGFDCAHSGDLSPKLGYTAGMLKVYADILEQKRSYETYQTLEYVQGECARLAEQLGALS